MRHEAWGMLPQWLHPYHLGCKLWHDMASTPNFFLMGNMEHHWEIHQKMAVLMWNIIELPGDCPDEAWGPQQASEARPGTQGAVGHWGTLAVVVHGKMLISSWSEPLQLSLFQKMVEKWGNPRKFTYFFRGGPGHAGGWNPRKPNHFGAACGNARGSRVPWQVLRRRRWPRAGVGAGHRVSTHRGADTVESGGSWGICGSNNAIFMVNLW